MGIGSITSTNTMSVMQTTAADLKDQKSKSIQNEITDVQQQIQKLSSKEELSANEKAEEKKKLQKEVSSLNRELEQHQEELLRAQERERMLAQLREDKKSADNEDSEDNLQATGASSDTTDRKNLPADEQQPAREGSVVTKSSDGVVILKEAANPDRSHAADTTAKQAADAKEEAAEEIKEEMEETAQEPAADRIAADFRPSSAEVHAMVTADASLNHAGRAGTIVARTGDGIAILKGEIHQDEIRGADANTERKQAELEKMEKQEQRAMAFQFSILGEANHAMKPAMETNVSAKDGLQTDTEANAYINAVNMLQDDSSQQKFFVSFG